MRPVRIVFAALLALAAGGAAYAIDRTGTGFYYPLGRSSWDHGCGGWLERSSPYGCYFDGYYHIAEDMMANVGDSVYAIWSGTVTNRSVNGWGTDNLGIVIRHKLNDGSEFLALYGHIRTSKVVGNTVNAGEAFATVGPYSSGNHLHFGVHPGLSMPASNWGMMPNGSWPSTNGFVDPINWITTRAPWGACDADPMNLFVTFGAASDCGSSSNPMGSLIAALAKAASGGTININNSGSVGGTLNPNGKTVTLRPSGGAVTLGP